MIYNYIPHTQATLVPGESIIFIARQHWVKYLSAKILIAFILFTSVYYDALWLAILAAIPAGYLLADRMFSEIVLTDRRFVRKKGVLTTDITELRTDHIDGIKLHQSLIGKILGYATVVIQCEGLESITIHHVAEPEAMHRAIELSESAPDPIFIRKRQHHTPPSR